MLVRALVTLAALSVPAEAQAAGAYVVHRGETLSEIAQRSNLSVSALAQANGISNPNLVSAGQVLSLPDPTQSYGYTSAQSYGYSSTSSTLGASTVQPATGAASTYSAPSGSYHVQWGDTLSGLALRFHTSVATLQALNPSLGTYLITGQTLNLCTSCASGTATGATQAPQYSSAAGQSVTPYGASSPATYSGYPSQTRTLITSYAQQYGLDPSLALAIGEQESNFQQGAVSQTGAIGVMQVEPDTARQISTLLGRPVNLYSEDDNIHAGVAWLAHLVAQYGGDERMAAAAYYQGSPSIAKHGFYNDTARYVSRAMDLRSRYGG